MEKEDKKEMILLLMTSYPKGPDAYNDTLSVSSPKMFYIQERCRSFEKKKRKIPRRWQLCSEYEYEILDKWKSAMVLWKYRTIILWCSLVLVALLFLLLYLQEKRITYASHAPLFLFAFYIMWRFEKLKSKVIDEALSS